jgi:hypothetical protein
VNTLIDPSLPALEPGAGSVEPGKATSDAEIRVKGKNVRVPAVCIDGRTIITAGKWLKTASARDEDLIEGDTLADPASFLRQLKESGLKADLFSFSQRLPEVVPKYHYRFDWDNVAAIPITRFSDWWDNRVDPGVRRAVRKAAKSAVETRVVEFDDALVAGISQIYNEVPVRQGKPFWHYQKSLKDVKLENSTYADRNIFLGAFWGGEMIGFIRLTRVGTVGSVIQILSMTKHYDKRPANALVAKAVEVCEQHGMSHLMYCNYIYNDPNSTLTEFKRRNGFEKVLLPKYFIPLTMKGHLALQLGLHLGLAHRIPKPLLTRLLQLRSKWYARTAKPGADTCDAGGAA